MLRKEHWNRVKHQVEDIDKTFGVSVEQLKLFKEDYPCAHLPKEMSDFKVKEIMKKTELIEMKENEEYRKLADKYETEKSLIKRRYMDEAADLKRNLALEVSGFKSLIDGSDSYDLAQ